ncbi:Rrf2 family transcriptional regulator [Micrococcales bacterium 31B]|nr:Rrf2 family transcriptional regulator [Micrococcales bacterium 31B]
MRISVFSDAALRVLIVLGGDPTLRLSARALGDATGVPRTHIAKVTTRLTDLGLVDATRGRSGGSQITAAGLAASVGHVMRSLNQREDVADCTSSEVACPMLTECRLREVLNRAREAFYAALDDVTIDSLKSPRQWEPIFASIALREGLEA